MSCCIPHHRPATLLNGPLAKYVKLWVAHAPGMPGTFSPPPPVSEPDMHHGRCVTHEPWCKPGSLTSGFLWSRWRGKRSRHSRSMHSPQFYVSGKRPMYQSIFWKKMCFHLWGRGGIYLNSIHPTDDGSFTKRWKNPQLHTNNSALTCGNDICFSAITSSRPLASAPIRQQNVLQIQLILRDRLNNNILSRANIE